MHKPLKLAIALSGADKSRAEALARHLQLPLCVAQGDEGANKELPPCEHYDFFLAYQSSDQHNLQQLSLVCPDGELGKPFFIDFAHGQLAHRRQFGGGRSQPLARAVGLKAGANPSVVDATAGMGRDAFVLATLGCTVTLIERAPILNALLADALQRAVQDNELDSHIPARMHLIEDNAIHWLQTCSEESRPDVVYLDPMYPHRSKSALVKKEMRILRALVGDDDDAGQLLQAALGCAKKRVVVKRPKAATPVIALDQPDLQPAAAVSSKNTRYDIYPVTT